jgi:methylmalonyl-CoA/ethylmalonyl-CoA epimerase
VSGIRFDHIAIAAEQISSVRPVLEGALGGAPAYGGVSSAYTFHQWRFGGGGRLEILEPRGADGFLRRFLRDRGPGVHHVTFLVPSLDDACDRARACGYDIVGYDDSSRDWKEAFLHPRQALGIVVQLAEPGALATPPISRGDGRPSGRPAVRMLGLRMRAHSCERARRQWGDVLRGRCHEGSAGQLIYQWPESPMRVAIEIDASAAEGALYIEYDSEQPAALPMTPHPALGDSFVWSPDANGGR